MQPANQMDKRSSLWNTGRNCNIATVAIDGFLDTQASADQISSLEVAEAIRSLDLKNKDAVLFLIDSPGGLPPAAEEISRAIKELPLPTVAFVRGSALSGGYWVAASTGHITALETASVGSIGVTSSYLDETELNRKEGYTYQEITSGPYKEVGNVAKPLTEESKKYLTGLTDDLFRIFAKEVMQDRKLSEEQFALVADAKSYIAKKALDLGLIDQIGGMTEVRGYLADKTGLPEEDLAICEPVRYRD